MPFAPSENPSWRNLHGVTREDLFTATAGYGAFATNRHTAGATLSNTGRRVLLGPLQSAQGAMSTDRSFQIVEFQIEALNGPVEFGYIYTTVGTPDTTSSYSNGILFFRDDGSNGGPWVTGSCIALVGGAIFFNGSIVAGGSFGSFSGDLVFYVAQANSGSASQVNATTVQADMVYGTSYNAFATSNGITFTDWPLAPPT